MWARWVHNPSYFGGPPSGDKIKVAIKPMLSSGPTHQHNSYLRGPRGWEKIKLAKKHPLCLGVHIWEK